VVLGLLLNLLAIKLQVKFGTQRMIRNMKHISFITILAIFCLAILSGCGGKAHPPQAHNRDFNYNPKISENPQHASRFAKANLFASITNPVVGQVLNTTAGTWSNNPTSFSYQWQRCSSGTCSNISGATSSTYTIVTADLGDTIDVVVTASNSGGSNSQTSAPTGVVAAGGPNCNLYASPTGSDSNSGTSSSPFATVTKLETSLTPGQTGCLNSGTYGSISSASPVLLTTGGTASQQITVTSTNTAAPAQINGWVSIRGDYITLQDVNINGSNTAFVGPNPCGMSNISESMEIEGNHDILQYINYFQTVGLGDGIGIGFPGAGHGDGTIIRYSAIHDLGACQAFDHLIYLSHGIGAQIYDNWLYNDQHGWGVQIYPEPSSAHIYSNVIDNAGSGFVFAGGSSVSNNLVEHNVVSNSTSLPNAGLSQGVGFSTCCGLGTGNQFNNNDVWNNPGGVGTPTTGLTISGNITSDPLFVNSPAHNYAVQSGSPAALYGLPSNVGPSAAP
jgi:hypothetical protein